MGGAALLVLGGVVMILLARVPYSDRHLRWVNAAYRTVGYFALVLAIIMAVQALIDGNK